MGPIPRTDGTATFNVEFPTGLGEYVVLVGSTPELGYWNVDRGVKMQTSEFDFPFWTSPPISVSLPRQGPVFYKYVLVKPDRGTEWENGPDRKIERSSFDNIMEQDVSIHDVSSHRAPMNDARMMDRRPGYIKLDSSTTWVSRGVMTLLGTWMLAAVVHAVFGLLHNGSKYGHGQRPRNGYKYGNDYKYRKDDSMRNSNYGYGFDGYNGYDEGTSYSQRGEIWDVGVDVENKQARRESAYNKKSSYSQKNSYSQRRNRRQKSKMEESAELPLCVLAGFVAGAGAVYLYRRDDEEERRRIHGGRMYGNAGKNNMMQRCTW